MGRPHPDDIAQCMCGVLQVSGIPTKDDYTAACRVVRTLANYYNIDIGFARIIDQLTANRAVPVNWWSMSIKENCAFALELYKEHYPEG